VLKLGKLDIEHVNIVVKAIKESEEYLTMKGLWASLKDPPFEYSTFIDVLIYLVRNNKVHPYPTSRGVLMIWVAADNPKLKNLSKTSKPVR